MQYLQQLTPNTASAALAFVPMVGIALATKLLPGTTHQAFPKPITLSDGTKVVYKTNGLLVHVVCLAMYFLGASMGLYSPLLPLDNILPLLSTLMLFVLFLTTYLYVCGCVHGEARRTGLFGFLLDYWTGLELHPHVFGLNIKFLSYRPAFFFNHLLNLCALYAQYSAHGTVTTRMILFQLLNGWYIVDYFAVESSIMTTWDIIAERFGFMLVFGDYVWMSFVFSLNAQLLINDLRPVSNAYLAATVLVFLAGYTIFRGSNSQKNQFKKNSQANIWGRPPKTLGNGRLLLSGWWGVARKINYLGDILMAISMSMPVGTAYIYGWLYPAYLIPLLIHRSWRDDKKCSAKYGALWKSYCQVVRWVMVPGLY